MPKVWEQEGHLRARPCFRGDIEEELKRVDVDRQHTEAAWTTTGATAAAEATATTARKVGSDCSPVRFTDARPPDVTTAAYLSCGCPVAIIAVI